MNGTRRHWADLNEFSFVAGMRFLFWICRRFGRWPFRLFLYPLLLWYVMTKPVPRTASRSYLRRVRQYVNIRAGMLGVIHHFAAFAEMILDKMLLWGGLFNTDNVTYHGMESIDRYVKDRRGALLFCAHLGNLELCRVLSRLRRDLPITILVHTKHAQAFNNMLGALNPESQFNLMQVTEMNPATAMLLASRVERGEFVVIAADRVSVGANPRVVMADFLGKPAPFPIGPYILGSVLQCPVYMLFSMRCGECYEVHFELLRESIHLPRKNREQALTELAADYAARLQYHCLRSPYQWFNFFDFWHIPTETSHVSR